MRITCPECETVLRPAKAPAPGKKVKCPKCGTMFAVEEDDAEEAPKKAKAPPAPAAAKKKTPVAAKPEKKPVEQAGSHSDRTDDDEGGTYSLFGESGEKKEEEDEPEAINYAPDTSIKDLRGPAQQAVIQPTNVLLGIGVAGFIGWVAMLIIFSIPVLFPLEPDEGTKEYLKSVLKIPKGLGMLADQYFAAADANKTGNQDKANVSFFQVLGYDFAIFGAMAWYLFLLAMVPVVLGMAYSGVQTYGIVRAQNLESRQWGIAGCIMAMVPINLGGLGLFICMLISFVLNMILDDESTIAYMIYGAATILTLVQLGFGVHLLMILSREEVVAGFEYVPDHDDVKVEKKSKSRRKKGK